MEFFIPFRQLPCRRVHLIVHARGDASALASPLRAALASVDPMLGLGAIQPLEAIYAALLGRERLLSALIGGFAVLALVVASVGVYGLMAEAVVRRTREIGIRIALGAASRDVAAMVLKHGLTLAAAGFLAGLVAAFAASRLLTSLLFGVTPTDAATYAATIAILAASSVLACAVPALRAARLDPAVALRHDGS
jgi:ABC-type antimicrobial peptide transport system permease subunit